MGHFRGSLGPQRFTVLINHLETEAAAMIRAAERDGLTLPRNANLMAAAHFELVTQTSGASSGDPRHQDRRPLIHLLVDTKTAADGPHESTACETVDGEPAPLSLLARYAYDAIIQAITLDADGLPINVGRRYRSATAAQWAALTALYSHCAWLDCDQPISRCQAHHLRPWEHGGPTDLDNLTPLCRHHHILVHHRNWQIRLGPDRKLDITRPDGQHHATTWPNRRPHPSDTAGSDAASTDTARTDTARTDTARIDGPGREPP